MKTFGYILGGFALAGFAWIWVAGLISYACNTWWTTREAYRKRVDGHVTEFLNDEQEMMN